MLLNCCGASRSGAIHPGVTEVSIEPVRTVSTGQLLFPALGVALKAGAAILEVYESAFAVRMKDDHSPLTLADQRAHEIIAAGLGGIAGAERMPLLSEEGKRLPYAERQSWGAFWLVDPLDGTKEFIKRNGEFTVNIALIEGGRPTLGVIYAPVKDMFYFAVRGAGSFRLAGGSALAGEAHGALPAGAERLGNTAAQSTRLTVVGSRSHAGPEMEVLLERLRQRYERVETASAGSSLKFCMVAEGSADLYVRHGPTMEWDTAAGQIIVEEAGGAVLDRIAGTPLGYNKEQLLNPGFTVLRSPHFAGLAELAR